MLGLPESIPWQFLAIAGLYHQLFIDINERWYLFAGNILVVWHVHVPYGETDVPSK